MAEDGNNQKSLKIRQNTEPVEVSYSPTLQGKAINAFSSLTTNAIREKAVAQWKAEQSKKPIAEQQSLFPGEGYKKPVILVRGDIMYTVPPWVVITGRTMQVLRYITEQFTRALYKANTPEEIKACRTIEISIKEVMAKFELSAPAKAKAMLSTELNTLAEVWAEWMEYVYVRDEKTGKKIKPQEVTHFKARFIGMIGETTPLTGDTVPLIGKTAPGKKKDIFKRGKAKIRLEEEMAEYLQNGYMLHIADNYYKIRPKDNPYSVAFYEEILICFRNNMNKPGNKYSDKVTVAVSTLLAKTDIPKYEDIASEGRINQKIFAKLERDMDKLQELELIKKWDYCKPNGVKLTQTERKRMSYKQFTSYNVEVTMPDNYPRYNTMPEAEEAEEAEVLEQ